MNHSKKIKNILLIGACAVAILGISACGQLEAYNGPSDSSSKKEEQIMVYSEEDGKGLVENLDTKYFLEGTEYAKLISQVTFDENIIRGVLTQSNIDTATPGIYEIEYIFEVDVLAMEKHLGTYKENSPYPEKGQMIFEREIEVVSTSRATELVEGGADVFGYIIATPEDREKIEELNKALADAISEQAAGE